MSTRESDPYQLQRLLSRRGFLSISGLGAAALLGIGLESSTGNSAAQRLASDGLSVRSADFFYHTPFALDASCVLSEDHFMVKVGKIDPAKDKVVAYSRADSEVEAILLQGGVISQAYRDPAAAGGWNIREIAAGATDIVAGVADNKQGWPTLHVFYRAASGAVQHLVEDRGDGTSSAKFMPVDDASWGLEVSGPLQITNDLYRNLLVFCVTPASSQNATDSKLGFTWTGWGLPGGETQSGVLTGFGLHQTQGPLATGSAAISYSASAFLGAPGLVLYLPTTNGIQIYQYSPDYKTEHLSINDKVKQFAVQPGGLPDHVAVESVDYLFSSREAGKWDWEPSNLNLGEDNYLKTSTLLNLFLVSGGTLSVVRQADLDNVTKNAVTPVFNPALPLQNGVASVSSQTRASAADELIAVDSGGNLEVLSKRADGRLEREPDPSARYRAG